MAWELAEITRRRSVSLLILFAWNGLVVDETHAHRETKQMLKTRNCVVYDTEARIVFPLFGSEDTRARAYTRTHKVRRKSFLFPVKSLFTLTNQEFCGRREEDSLPTILGSSHRPMKHFSRLDYLEKIGFYSVDQRTAPGAASSHKYTHCVKD